jgi:predicted RNA methylase
VYSVYDYCAMAKDEARVHAYTEALKQHITPESVVVDLGTGVGLFAIVAAKLGARRVFAVDLTDAIEVGRELARAAGVEDRVTFIKRSAWEVTPPELAHILFYDLRGTSPLFHDNFRLVHHARTHWLRPDGVAFPTRDRLVAAVVRAPALCERLSLARDAVARLGIPVAPVERIFSGSLHTDRHEPITAEDVLTTSCTWAELTYGQTPPKSVAGDGAVDVTKPGLAQGVCVWFETDVIPGISYDTAPGTQRTYARSFLPFRSEVLLAAGDRVELTLSALTDGSEWAWAHSVIRAGGTREPGPRQSTFEAEVLSLDALLASAPSAKPKLTTSGERARSILDAFDGERSLLEIARSISRGDDEDAVQRALSEVRAVARKHAR